MILSAPVAADYEFDKLPALQPRVRYVRVATEGIHTPQGRETYVRNPSLEPGLLELIKLRTSQTNGCAFCVDMDAGPDYPA